jgi:hypothetical protein
MKKLIQFTLIAMLAMVINTKAQSYDVQFGKTDTYRSIYTTAADTINGVDEVSKVFKVDKGYQYNYTLQMSGDTVFVGDSTVFNAYGSIDGKNWFAMQNVTWHMSTADTVILFNSNSKVGWRFIKGTMKGYGATNRAKLNRLFLQINRD